MDPVGVHVGFSVVDLAINAAAATAAAATGAHVNESPLSADILRTAALAGMIKSGVLNFFILIYMTSSNAFLIFLLVFVSSSFGIAFLVTTFVCQRVLDRVPGDLLVAAAAAAAPGAGGTIFSEATGPIQGILAVGWDALTGYTFVRVARNHGFHVCELKAAAAAGAVYGTLVWFIKLPYSLYCEAQMKRRDERMREADLWHAPLSTWDNWFHDGMGMAQG